MAYCDWSEAVEEGASNTSQSIPLAGRLAKALELEAVSGFKFRISGC